MQAYCKTISENMHYFLFEGRRSSLALHSMNNAGGSEADLLLLVHSPMQRLMSLLLRRLRDEFDDEAEVNDCDGLRFDWPDGFLSLRLSSTEGSLRLISEARSRETAQERAWRARLLWERLSS